MHVVKGNNDQMIVANHFDRQASAVSKEVLETLRNLDLAKHHREAMSNMARYMVGTLPVMATQRIQGSDIGFTFS